VIQELQAVIDEVVRQTRVAYYDVLLARDRIVVQEQNVKLLEKQLEDVTNRFEAETISQFDLLRAEVELANAQPALIRARNAYRNAIDNLYLTIGFNSGSNAYYYNQRFSGELTFQPISYNLSTLLQQAEASRPEINALRSIADARKEGISVAKSGYLPEVYLVGGYQLDKYWDSLRITESTTGWSIGVESSWAIFDGRRTRGRVIQARSQQRQAEIDVEERKLSVDVEVRLAISALTEAEQLASAAQKVVEQAEESLRLAQVRFESGAATQLDLLQAQVALTEARTNELESNYSYLVALANLRRATGDTEYSIND
jgi:outer membrane protein